MTIRHGAANIRMARIDFSTMKHFVKHFIRLTVIIAVFSGSAGMAFSNPEFIVLEKAKLSLLDGGEGKNGQILAGLSISLEKNVKTYWRMPGDSGLPPIFDFSASRNVDHVDIAWPAPSRLKDAEGTILGYENAVIFPLIVTPRNAKEPVTLSLTIDFGLCDTLCMPAKASLTRALASGGAARSSIESFLARVPKHAVIKGEYAPSLISIEPAGQSPGALIITLRSPSPVKDVILEGPETWYFGQAEQLTDMDGTYRITVPIAQKPSSSSLGGLVLTLTAISEDGATETAVTLDASGSIR